MQIIGIDSAVDEKNIGLARAEFDDGLTLIEVKSGDNVPVARTVTHWIQDASPTLLAIDAPLGWPDSLGKELRHHHAGQLIETERNKLFNRYTDRYIRENLGKKPMEVGADRIARTAHAALELLHDVRKRTAFQIPLAFSPDMEELVEAIEVYPGATLAARGWKSSGYKSSTKRDIRERLAEKLSTVMDLGGIKEPLLENTHIFDGVLCTLAGWDFLQNCCFKPADNQLASKEGWIWVLNPFCDEADNQML